jgi:ABC-2 type transport system permease protein
MTQSTVDTRTVHAGRALVRVEAKLFLREPVAVFFAVAFPPILLLVLGSAMPGFTAPAAELGGQRPIDIYLPVTLALAIGTVTMVTLLATLSAYREKGVLRRLSATPVSPASLLAAQLIVSVGALVLGCGLAYATAAAAFGVKAPSNVVGVVIAFLLGATAMGSIALLIAALTPTARAASGLGTLVYFPMMFAAGVWTPGPLMPAVVRRVADFTPLGAASQALQDAWAGGWPRPLHLVVLAGFTVACGACAIRWFRWE